MSCRADIAQGKSTHGTKSVTSVKTTTVLQLPSVSFVWAFKTFGFFVGTFLIGFGTGFGTGVGVGQSSVVDSPLPPP